MQHHQNPATLDSDPQLPQIKIHHPSSAACTPTPTAGSGRKIGVAVDLSDESNAGTEGGSELRQRRRGRDQARAGGNAGTAVVEVKEGNEGEAVIKDNSKLINLIAILLTRERHKACESSSSLEDLNEDLQVEILCRVPYKYLMRCKCVSKHWFFLISNPNPSFVAHHRLLSMEKQHPSYTWTYMYFSTKKKKLKAASKDPVFQSQGFSLRFLPCYQPHHHTQPILIFGNVNDLFLCSAPSGIRDDPAVYYICNPLTMQWVALPPTITPIRFRSGINFICEKEGTFKVVRVVSIPPIFFVEIFSSETGGQWIQRKVDNKQIIKHFIIRKIERTVTCSGTLYVASGSVIVAFSLNSLFNNNTSAASDYHIVHHPKAESSQGQYMNIMACQGRLRAFKLAILNAVPVLYIWDLIEDCSLKGQGHEYEWSPVHCVPFSNMVTFTNKEWFSDIVKTRLPLEEKEHLLYKVLCFLPGDENVVYLRIHDRVASYDMWNKTLTFHSQIKAAPDQSIFEVLLPLRPTPVPKL